MLLDPRFATEVGKVLGGTTTATIRQPGYSGNVTDQPAGTVAFDDLGEPIKDTGSVVKDAAEVLLENVPCIVGEAPDKELIEQGYDVGSVEIMLFRYVPKSIIGRSKELLVTDANGVETVYNVIDVNHDSLNTITLVVANTATV